MERRPDVDLTAVAALLRRVLGSSPEAAFERTADGVSTQVYRVFRGSETFYLRVAEESHEDLGTDAELHERLRGLGVSVAGVVHVEYDPAIDRSVVLTTEVPGASLTETTDPDEAAAVAEAAGGDLALVNSLSVHGFGFVQRTGAGWPLRAEYSSYDGFLTSHLPPVWPGALERVFTPAGLEVVEGLIDHERRRPPARAALAHGDLDVTAIFGASGRYTGLIDFGEIRGADPFFDLGHFLLHDGESVPASLLPAVLRGYGRVRPLPTDHMESIHRSAVLSGLRQLCRWLGPPRRLAPTHPAVARRRRRLAELIDHL